MTTPDATPRATPDPTPDAFDLLGLEPTMNLRAAQIDGAFRQAAASAHPDRSGGAGDADASDIEAINQARRVLLDPESRARAIFARLGGVSAGDPVGDDDRDTLPDGFLMEMMQTRLEIESELEALAGGSETDRQGARERWEDWAHEQRRAAIDEVSGHLDRAASLTENERGPVLAEARRALNAWRYIERLIEQLDPGHSGLD